MVGYPDGEAFKPIAQQRNTFSRVPETLTGKKVSENVSALYGALFPTSIPRNGMN